MTTTTDRHPAWCDNRLCQHLGPDRHHRDVTLDWTGTDHTRITVGLSRFDNPVIGEVDHTHIGLTLDDTEHAVVVDLHPTEARALAARLYADAARADTVDRADATCGACGNGWGSHCHRCGACPGTCRHQ